MNIVETDEIPHIKEFNKIQIGDIFASSNVLYMRVHTMVVDGRGRCNSIRLVDGMAFYFEDSKRVKEVQHELRILR